MNESNLVHGYRRTQISKIHIQIQDRSASGLNIQTTHYCRMVLLTASARLNQWLGPHLLRWGIYLRYSLAGGIIRDNPRADVLCGLPVAQKLIQIEVHDESKAQVIAEAKKNSYFTEQDEASARIRVFERYLRPALIPNEKWSDVRKWQFHSRLIKWVRAEFLVAKYGSSVRRIFKSFPALRKSPQFGGQRLPTNGSSSSWMTGKFPFDLFTVEDSSNPKEMENCIAKLPYSTLVAKAFGMSDWRHTKDLVASREHMVRIAKQLDGSVLELRGGNVAVARIPDTASLADLSFEEVLEVAGGHVMQCGPFNALCEEVGIHQLWTRDYVEQLGRYILQRSKAMPNGNNVVVLDVGAGDGILAEMLRDYFNADLDRCVVKEPASRNRANRKGMPTPREMPKVQSKIPTVVASDSGAWNISPIGNVKRHTVQEAVDSYAALFGYSVIVLCSWMPMNEDWSATFRKSDVEEYILIGECDDGQCGDNWETWGNPKHLLDDIDSALDSSEESFSVGRAEYAQNPVDSDKACVILAPYLVDGYERHDLDFALHQFSRFDCQMSKFGSTVSFRRRNGQC
jgi:hypothetical protein